MRNADNEKDREKVKDEQSKKKRNKGVTGLMIGLLKEFRINYRENISKRIDVEKK